MSYNNGNAASQTLFAVDGTKAIAAAGALYAAPSVRGKSDSQCTIAPGVLIIADANKENSLGNAPSAATNPSIRFAVGIDTNNDGLTDYYRFSAPIAASAVEGFNSQDEGCGQNGIQDIFFKCIKRGKAYGIEIAVKNNESDSFGRMNQGWRYHFAYTPTWDACDDCSEEVSADELMCGLYNVVNKLDAPGDWNIRLNGEVLPADHEFPFWVDKLYSGNTTYEYNLVADKTDDTECQGCVNYPDIGGVRSVAGGFDVTFSPGYITTIGANKYTRKAAMEAVANQITVALAGNGSASVVECEGKCCDLKLEINSCLTDLQLFDGDDVTIAPTQTTNPFSAVPVYQECEDCDNPAQTTTFDAGLRVRAKSFIVNDGMPNLIPTNDVQDDYVSDVEVYPTDGFHDLPGTVHVARKQSPAQAKGQGPKWANREKRLVESFDGEVIEHHLYGGKYMEPIGNDILRRLTVEEDKSYCVLSMSARYTGHTDNVNGNIATPMYGIDILVNDPAGSETLSADLQSALAGYFSTGEHVDFSTVCGTTV